MCTMNCTVTTEKMRGLLGADIAAFESQVSRAPRGAEGVLTLPFFNGERTPNLPRARACIIGLDGQNTRPENLLRSALEGATFALRYGTDRLVDLGIDASEIVLTGGGVGSATWRQVVADVCHAPVTVFEQDEGASFGAALQALCILEGGSSDDLVNLASEHLSRDEPLCCEPDRLAVSEYQEAYEAYREAVSAVTPLYS
jgi:xylulokinase